jgi:hypothetical protein
VSVWAGLYWLSLDFVAALCEEGNEECWLRGDASLFGGLVVSAFIFRAKEGRFAPKSFT